MSTIDDDPPVGDRWRHGAASDLGQRVQQRGRVAGPGHRQPATSRTTPAERRSVVAQLGGRPSVRHHPVATRWRAEIVADVAGEAGRDHDLQGAGIEVERTGLHDVQPGADDGAFDHAGSLDDRRRHQHGPSIWRGDRGDVRHPQADRTGQRTELLVEAPEHSGPRARAQQCALAVEQLGHQAGTGARPPGHADPEVFGHVGLVDRPTA